MKKKTFNEPSETDQIKIVLRTTNGYNYETASIG